MRWRGAKSLISTSLASTQISSSSNSEKSGTERSVSGLQPIDTPRIRCWKYPQHSTSSRCRATAPRAGVAGFTRYSSSGQERFQDSRRLRAEFARAVGAGTNLAKMLIAVDSGRMAVAESDVDRVVADGVCGARCGLGFKHRQHGCRGRCGTRGCESLFAYTLVVAGCAWALVT